MTQAAETTALVVTPIQSLMADMAPTIRDVLPAYLSPDRMTKVILGAVRKTPLLAKCDRASLAKCIVDCVSMGLEPNTPSQLAFLIPREVRRNVNGTWQAVGHECTLMVGYQGLLKLARNSGEIADIYAEPVFEGDEFEWELGLNRSMTHKPLAIDRADASKVTHVYAVAKLKSGETAFQVLTRQQVDARRGVSANETNKAKGGPRKSGTPWETHWIAMARKTAIRELAKWIPRSEELDRGIDVDYQHERIEAEQERQVLPPARTFAGVLSAATVAEPAQLPVEAPATETDLTGDFTPEDFAD